MFFYDKCDLLRRNKYYKKIADAWKVEWTPAPRVLQYEMINYYYKAVKTEDYIRASWQAEVKNIPILDDKYFKRNPNALL